MTFKTAPAPHFRSSDRCFLMCLDVLLCLLPLCVFSAIYYGWRPVWLLLLSTATAVACETVCNMLLRRNPSAGDGTALVTGALIGAMMSPLSPYWLPMLASAFAICVVKMPFGGAGRNLFNPAAGGMALVTLFFPSLVFTYPTTDTTLPVGFDSLQTVLTQKSPALQLANGASPLFSHEDLLLGRYPGPIGATAIVILVACGVYLFIRRSGSLAATVSYLATCALIVLVFPRAPGALIPELCSGYLLFAGIFLINDPVTTPRFWLGRVFYGILAGALVMLLRYFGRFEDGACFAVLLANAAAPILDRNSWRLLRRFHRNRLRELEGGDGSDAE